MNLIIILVSINLLVQTGFGQQQTNWTVTQFLDQEEKYQVAWTIDVNKKNVEFEVQVETLGYIGFGLSPNGAMTGADIIIGGIHDGNSTTYFSDRHGTGNLEPKVDIEKNWDLISGSQNETHTTLKFTRLWNTCDEHNQDVAINDDTLKIIWSYGPTDAIQYHSGNRGALSVNLLDVPMPPPDISEFKTWQVIVNDTMPAQHTSYWCSIHRGPNLTQTHHVIGFDALVKNPHAIEHTHHFIFTQCIIPNDGIRDILESHVGQPGFDCKSGWENPSHPPRFCEKRLYIWATGGQRTMLPEHVGLPIGNNNQGNEYVMLEIHYNNPNVVANRTFETGLEVYYTDVVRNETAEVLIMGHNVWWAHTIPPMSTNFVTVGHCSPECTQKAFPENGINIVITLLHSHLSGRKIKVRHFRNGEELPFLAVDDNYDFNFQQNRPNRPEIKVLPGDQLSVECTTDTTWKNSSSVTIGDLSSSDEMCEAIFIYYPPLKLSSCESSIEAWELLHFFGIINVTDNPLKGYDPLVTYPPSMANKSYTEVVSTMIDWNPKLIAEFQEFVRYGTHDFYCVDVADPTDALFGSVNYPNVKQEYKPIDQCLAPSTSSNPFQTTSQFLLVLSVLKTIVNYIH